MNTATLVIASLSLVTSATTLVVVLVGAKKVENSIVEVKARSNGAIHNLKSALDKLEI